LLRSAGRARLIGYSLDNRIRAGVGTTWSEVVEELTSNPHPPSGHVLLYS
jgi:hypothetical protein